MIDRIDFNVREAHEYTVDAVRETTNALNYQSSARRVRIELN
jgi:t-SNARE complex subunit (syntaxin)